MNAAIATPSVNRALRVLVIEDEDGIRELLVILLEEAGYGVLTAPHGLAALELLDRLSQSPDVLLVDMLMPVMDGRAFIEAYRQRTRSPVPIIVMSAGRNLAELARDAGADGMVPKPFTRSRLLAELDGCARQGADGAPVAA